MVRKTTAIQLLLAAATALLIVFGWWWAQGEADRACSDRRDEMLSLLAGEAAGARESLETIINRSRASSREPTAFPVQRLSVAYLPETPRPAINPELLEAERIEFTQEDPSAALRLYYRLLEEELDPTDRVTALRNVARLEFLLNRKPEAMEALQDAIRIDDSSDLERFLAFYELAQHDEESRQILMDAIEKSDFDSVPPGRREFVFTKLGGDPERIPGLTAAARIMAADRPDDLVSLSSDSAAWRLQIAGGWIEIAQVQIDDLLAALIPGMKAGRWILSNDAAGEQLGRPFPDFYLDLGATSLEELDRVERSAFWKNFSLAAVPAVLLVAAALFLVLSDARQARLAKAKQDFLWSITHEFKTPIANILLYAETIHAHALEDPDSARGFAKTVGVEARRLLDLVQQSLDVAAGDAYSFPGSERFDLRTALQEALAGFDERAAGRSIALSVILPDEAVYLTATRKLVIRAVSGIVDNAIAFASSKVRIELAGSPGSVAVQIDDDGPGIPEADMERVFEPYVQLEETATRTSSGTGLGLTFVRSCVENDGGTVTAGHSPLGGASFRIEYAQS